MIPYVWLEEADQRIRTDIIQTPLQYDPIHQIFLKWENHQETGSFKLRGALNKVMTLQPWERERGLVAASAGNHGQGVAVAGRKFDIPVIIFASEHAVPSKIAAMRRLGAEVHLVAGGYGEAEQIALTYATNRQMTWVSPYNDGQVIAGQASLALETLRQLDELNARETNQAAWIVPVGGGGLCAGIACALYGGEHLRPGNQQLIGVQSDASPFFHAIYHQGNQTGQVEQPSLADGLSGPVEEGSVTIPILQRYLDDLVLVSEAEIEGAIAYAWKHYHEKLEGSAAVSLAAVLYGQIQERPAVVILTGGNIQPELHQKICADHEHRTKEDTQDA
jgi:threonine dehydratase